MHPGPDLQNLREQIEEIARADSAPMVAALESVRAIASELRILGSYPKASGPESLGRSGD